MNFKLGDLVEVIDKNGHPFAKLGDRGKIIYITTGNPPTLLYIRTQDGREYGMYFTRFRLIASKPYLFQTISLSGEENRNRVKQNFPFLNL
jgi:hypothetical protein